MISCSSWRELAGLAQDVVGNGHLADVVQESAARDDLDFRRGNAHGAGQRDGVSGDALGVAFGFGVLQVERVAQRLERDVVGVLQIFHGLAQHLGAGAHHLFEVLLVVVALLQRLAMVEGALHGGHQVLALKGLEQIVVGAAAHGVDGHADVVNGRDHDDGKIGLLRMDAVEQGDAVSVLHHDVGEHQVEGVMSRSSSASRPLAASCTSYPWRSSWSPIMERTCASSSTTRIRADLRRFASARASGSALRFTAGSGLPSPARFNAKPRSPFIFASHKSCRRNMLS